MRWIYIVLALIAVTFLMTSFAPQLWKTGFHAPVLNIQIMWAYVILFATLWFGTNLSYKK